MPPACSCLPGRGHNCHLLAAPRFICLHLRSALGPSFHPDVVQWCLTVPAMWSEAAKALMRDAACRAGLVEVGDSTAAGGCWQAFLSEKGVLVGFRAAVPAVDCRRQPVT